MYHLFRLVANALTEAENHRIEAQLGQKLRGFELLQESMSTVATSKELFLTFSNNLKMYL